MIDEKNWNEMEYGQIIAICFRGKWIHVASVGIVNELEIGETKDCGQPKELFHPHGKLGPFLRVETSENQLLYLRVTSVTGFRLATPY